ncbi:MAG TPA: transketolase family protein, partial [Candidatus Hydrogenedentes bacterium]|nr:transketolase family protein [Candidatus Hydrogenedentota bacterium]
ASGKGCVFEKLGIPDVFTPHGYPEDLQHMFGIDADGIVDKVRAMMGREFEADESWEDEI